MSKLELKSAFMTGAYSTSLVKKFLTKEMDVKMIHEWAYLGQYVMDIPQEDYERVLPQVQQYVVEQNIPYVKWINHYDVAIECGYVQLAHAMLRKKRTGSPLWCVDKYLPEDILEYTRKMKEALGTDIMQSYNEIDRSISFASRSTNYKQQLELMKNFIINEGTGPFYRMIPVTYTGEVQKQESFVFLKTK